MGVGAGDAAGFGSGRAGCARRDRLLGNARATVKVVREHDVEVAPFAGASAVWAHEQHTAGPDGEGVSLLLAGVVGVSVVVVCASGSPVWDWGAVSEGI